jgi:hypothetical protein
MFFVSPTSRFWFSNPTCGYGSSLWHAPFLQQTHKNFHFVTIVLICQQTRGAKIVTAMMWHQSSSRLTLAAVIWSFCYYSIVGTMSSIPSINAQVITGNSDFSCSDSTTEGVSECLFNENFPFAGTQSALVVACGSDTIVEPSPDICAAECLLILGENDVVLGSCNSCEIIPDNASTDGTVQLSYDCSNILEGKCVGRTTEGECISNLPGQYW